MLPVLAALVVLVGLVVLIGVIAHARARIAARDEDVAVMESGFSHLRDR